MLCSMEFMRNLEVGTSFYVYFAPGKVIELWQKTSSEHVRMVYSKYFTEEYEDDCLIRDMGGVLTSLECFLDNSTIVYILIYDKVSKVYIDKEKRDKEYTNYLNRFVICTKKDITIADVEKQYLRDED